MSEELKSCPFCGSAATLRDGFSNWNFVSCANQDCSINGGENDFELHTEAWNTRPIEDALRAELDEAKEKLKEATEFRIGRFVVGYCGKEKWAVCDGALVLTTSGEWNWEPLPSARDDEFLSRARFSLDEAIDRARQLETVPVRDEAAREGK